MSEKDRPLSYMLNTSHLGKMPTGATLADWSRYTRQFQPVETSARDMAANIWRGYAIAPLFDPSHGRRKMEHFQRADYIAFDCDHNSIEQVRALDWVDWFASFAYTTPSHTPDAPRCRVVFVLETPTARPERFRQIYAALAWRFKTDGIEVDPACKDVLRLYYGSPRCEVWPNWSILGDAAADVMIADYQAAIPADNEHVPASPVRPAAAGSLPARFLEVAAGKLLDNVRTAADGAKHSTLCKIAYVFGGYVASGYYAEADAVSWLEDAIRPRAASFETAQRTIRDCLTAGRAAPLAFEAAQQPAGNRPNRPLTPQQRNQNLMATNEQPARFTVK